MIYFNSPKSVYLKYREKINKTIFKVLNSGNYVKSKELKKFEKKFAQYIKTKFAVGVGNATDAIFVALKALNIGYGDEVITVSYTATGTAMGILNTGAKPVFSDISISGLTKAAFKMLTPVCSSPSRETESKDCLARSRASPPPGTIPS